MGDETEVVLSPGEAARRLDVSPSGLRRLAVEYGKVYGDLPKDSGGTSRIWPQEAVIRLEAARALLSAGQARSIRDALLAVEGGAAPRVELAAHDGRVAEALGVVAARLEALQDSNERLEAEVAALRGEVREGRALASGPGSKPDALPSGPAVADVPNRKPENSEGHEGLLVRVARRIEKWLKL